MTTQAVNPESDSYDHATFKNTVEDILGVEAEGLDESPAAPQSGEDATEPSPPTAATAWWETLPDDARQEWDRTQREKQELQARHEQYVRSNEGRIAALQRKAEESARMAEEIAQDKRRVTELAAAQAAEDEDLAKLNAEIPDMPALSEVNKRTRSEVRAVKAELEKLTSLSANLQQEQAAREAQWAAVQAAEQAAQNQRLIDDATDALQADFPNWDEEAKSPQFRQWFQTQPAEVKALAESTSVASARVLLKTYYDEAGPPSYEAADIAERRRRQLANSVAPRGAGSAQADETTEYSLYFNRYLNEMLPKRG